MNPAPNSLRPASAPPEARGDVRLLVVDPARATFRDAQMSALPSLLAAGDLLVVNDAATLPASLAATTLDGSDLAFEVRLAAPPEGARLRVVTFGAGDWRTRTEDRVPPPRLALGARVAVAGAPARVVARAPESDRLVELELEAGLAWPLVYAHGRPIQYSYLAAAEPLWTFQTAYAARPWAVEMPSAGRALTWATLAALRRRGVAIAALTHAAGLSATGDPALDRALPLPERYAIPGATRAAIARARARGGRVLAVGTTVVRALEGAAVTHGLAHLLGAADSASDAPVSGVTDLRIRADLRPLVVDGVLSGMHDERESHFQLLAAFAPAALLSRAIGHAAAAGYRAHELGDATLVLPATSPR